MTTWKENPDGTRTFYVDADALEAAALLDDLGAEAPVLTPAEFDELASELAKVEDDEEE